MNASPKLTRDERRRQAREQREAAERAAAAAQRRRRRLWQLGAVGVVAVAAVAIAVALSTRGSSAPAARPGQPPANAGLVAGMFAGIPEHGITIGDPRAPVTLVEFNDLKCPICRQYSLETLPTLVQDYVRTGKVKMVMRLQHFVGEQYAPGDSLAAARFGEAAGLQDKLWPFAELFYNNQQDETTRYVTDAFLRRIGSGVRGLNVRQAMAQRFSPQVSAQIQQSYQLAVAHGFTAVPSFLLGHSGQTLKPLPFTSTIPHPSSERSTRW